MHSVFRTGFQERERGVTVRRYRPLADFEVAIADLQAAQRSVEATLQLLKSNNMDDLFVHADNMIDRRIPELVAWAARIYGEAQEQCQSHKAGRKSQAEMTLDKAARAAAKAGIAKKGLQQSREPRKAAPARKPKS